MSDDLIRVRVLVEQPEVRDGIARPALASGQVYELDATRAKALLNTGQAEPVAKGSQEQAEKRPAPVTAEVRQDPTVTSSNQDGQPTFAPETPETPAVGPGTEGAATAKETQEVVESHPSEKSSPAAKVATETEKSAPATKQPRKRK